MAGQFWYPSMTVTEIVEAFTGWGMSVTHEQILRPTSDFVLDIYTSCLTQVTRIDQDELLGPNQAALATLDNPVRVLGVSLCFVCPYMQP